MFQSNDPRSAIDAAGAAATAGDYASAERLLRHAAREQEETFGAFHPELANTLNNLGIICEITNKPADAERCYRKACAIAAAVLEADHPFAATSRNNLIQFCEAQGKPVEAPAAPSPTRLSRHVAVIVAGLCAVVVVMVLSTSAWLRTSSPADSAPAGVPSPQENPAPPREIAEPGNAAKQPAVASRGSAASTRARTSRTVTPAVASAGLCRDLSTGGPRRPAGDWHCTPAGSPLHGGALFFYTRLKSPQDTTVQHRWYRGDRLYQAVTLRIRANERSGYRTYSRYTLNPVNAGTWKVELRSSDGAMLHEERFLVR